MVVHRKQFHLAQLRKYGAGICFPVNREIRERLGWNRDDALRLDIINGSLVVTKVTLQGVNVAAKVGVDGRTAAEVLPTSDNGEIVKPSDL